MKTIIGVIVVIVMICVVCYLGLVLNNLICPKGIDEWSISGCGHSMVEINEHNCEKIGGTYFYGGSFSAGGCVK